MNASRTAGYALGGLGVLCALVGIIVIDGISIEFPGIIFAALGYYFALNADNRPGQVLAIAAAVLNVVSMVVSGLLGLPQ